MARVISMLIISAVLHEVWSQPYFPDKTREDCADGYCLVLYKRYYASIWQYAYDDCAHLNMSLVPILTANIQGRVERLLQDANDAESTDIREVWTAGRQKYDETRRYLDGRSLEAEVTYTDQSEENCMFWDCIYKRYQTDNCAEESGSHSVVCQKPAEHYSSAGSYNILSGEYSYRVVNTKDDWFSARTLCVQDGGDLIHSNILDSNFKQTICDRINPVSGVKWYWVGLTKYPWLWEVPGQEPKPITYFSWEERSYRQDDTYECITLRSRYEYQWVPQPCDILYTPYFLCANGTIPGMTTSMTTTPTIPTTTATSPTGTPSPPANTPTPTTTLVFTTPTGTEPPSQSTSCTVCWALFGTTAAILLGSVIMNFYQWRSQTQSPADKPDHTYVNVPDQRPNPITDFRGHSGNTDQRLNPVTRPVTDFRGHSGNTDTLPDAQYLELDARSRDPDPAPEQRPAVYMTVGGDNEQEQVPSADGITYDYEEI